MPTISGGLFTTPRKGRADAGFFQPYLFFTEEPQLVPRYTGESVIEDVYEDRVYTLGTGGTVTDVFWPWQFRLGGAAFEMNRACNNGKLTPDPENPFRWIYAGTGTTQITLSNTGGYSVTKQLVCAAETGEAREFDRFATASAAFNAAQNIDSRLAGKSPATALSVWTAATHYNQTYVRNTACWAADLDLTGVSPWNSTDSTQRCGTLVAPDTALVATHYPLYVGSVVRFVSDSNTVTNRTVTGVKDIGRDIRVVKLNADVPAGITHYKVLPANYRDKLPIPGLASYLTSPWPVPVLFYNRNSQVCTVDVRSKDLVEGLTMMTTPIDPQRLLFNRAVITGDSGKPVFFAINNELVLATLWLSGGAGGGYGWTGEQIAAINAAMTELGSPYEVTPINLDSFPSYNYE